ncbi:HAMP domain-containing sensor histidine kinase [Pelomonas sp. KK5]|uniref:sensor histidine kinase n=1 Tax=Pelomonas sp. KK5 TaxID=1855730 RepID=UPI00097C577C|nr:HAMP domain-containing sensor histidine kinase [Pelomonas sp. KK5]
MEIADVRQANGAAVRRRRLRQALLVSPLLIGNVLLLALCLLGFQVLSSTRAYVGGESFWSKGRALAIQHLRAYAATGVPDELQAFESALAVPLGDRQARLALEQPVPDLDRARRGFEQGGLSPEDIPAAIRLYRCCGETPLMAEAVEAWRTADQRILMLKAIADELQQLHESVLPADARAARSAELLRWLDQLEAELRGFELRYSDALGRASRATFYLLSLLLALFTALLSLTLFLVVRHSMKRQSAYETELEDANQRWTLAAAGDGLGLFEWRLRGDTVTMDANALAVYGLGAEAAGQPIPRARLSALVDPADQPQIRLALEKVQRDAELFRQRYRIHPPGVAERHVEIAAVMRGELDAGDRRMIGIVRDVSAGVRQERAELDRATAQRAAAARMEFLSRLSHELRTPLNAVLGFSDLLALDGAEPLSERQRQRVQLIADAGRHLLRLVDDVLDISRIDSGRLSIERRPTPLAPVLASAAALSSAEREQFAVRLELPELPPALAVWGDAHRLGQVLTNLLSNGFKYNRPGGTVRVQVAAEGPQVRIEVHDEGPGIGAEEVQHLFQAFKRLPGAVHRSGTGLGLTIVKLLVEQMGGSVEVRSAIGQGSVFSVTLEAAPAGA